MAKLAFWRPFAALIVGLLCCPASRAQQNATEPYFAASQILIAYQGAIAAEASITRSKGAAYQKALSILAELEADPSRFEPLARAESDGSYAAQGGRLAPWQQGTMVRAFQEAVEALRVGEITREPVETQFGYYVVRRERVEPGE